VPGLSGVVQVGTGGQDATGTHTCVLRSIGQVSCSGANADGQLGNGTTVARTSFAPAAALSSPAVQLSVNTRHNCAVLANRTVVCWGNNTVGQLGVGDRTDRSTPTLVPGLTDVVQVATGGSHTCALRADGTVRCWGSNFAGVLGDGTTTDRLAPVTVLPVSGSGALGGVIQITAGGSHTCALISNGTVRCWGIATLNGGGSTENLFRPVVVPGVGSAPLSGVSQMSAGGSHTCAVLVDGTGRCWGFGTDGRLGNGSTLDQLRPVTVTGLGGSTPVTQISAGRFHTCAVVVGQLNPSCWGSDSSRALGGETAGNRSTPTEVLGE
jgi:alpha-tubulin suppressor-like RCC1 family protein